MHRPPPAPARPRAAAALAFAGLAAAALAGCDSLIGMDPVLGYVTAVIVPDTVTAGQTFTVTVRTAIPDRCWRIDRTDVEVRDLTATITPWDEETGGVCATQPGELTHTAEITFDRAGQGRVEVRGRNATDRAVPVVVE